MKALTLILITVAVLTSWVIAFLADVKKLDKKTCDDWGQFARGVTFFGAVLAVAVVFTAVTS